MTDREARRQERMEYELRALPRRPTPDGHKWMVDSIIGEGGFGRAYLWNLVRRRDQVVVDRVVIKYCEPDTHDIIARHGPGFGEIAEVFMQRSMMHDSEDPLDDFTVPLLAAEHCSWALDAWRFYTPYYSFGDLYKFILKQGVENPATPTKGHRQVPEPFVWYLLHRLACAARIMDQTLANEDMDYQIVHCDFKPANLFLGAPGSLGSRAQFPIYPPVYVGDFGNAKITYTGDSRRHEMVGTCTPGWSAPEITPFTSNHMPKSWQAPASSKTNIWQIGYVLLSIMQGKVDHPDGDMNWDTLRSTEYAPRYKPLPKRTPELEAENPLRVKYSTELLDTLHACVQFDPEKRPTPEELHAHVSAHTLDHTDGVEDWGTYDWFQDKCEEVDPDSDEDEVDEHGQPIAREEPIKGQGSELLHKLMRALHLPGARKRSGRKGKSGKTPIVRTESPVSRMARRRNDYNRRKKIVARQIKEGLEPKLNRFVSTEPNDDAFNLDDKYKLIHPRGDHLLNSYWAAPPPAKRSFTSYIDDLYSYYDTKKAFEQAHPNAFAPLTGLDSYNFRLNGQRKGEIFSDDEDYEESLQAALAHQRAQEAGEAD
ncbi:kinase-like protein [Aureobasidium pullulans]|nr:kinase-like protein [Aureobasidium pullulans]